MSVDIPVSFEIPPDFRELVVGADADQVRAAVTERIGADLIEDVPGDILKQALADYWAASHAMAATGAFYAATCFGLIDEGRLSSGSLLFARQEADCRDPEVAVEGIRQILDRSGPRGSRQVERRELPCGPAAVSLRVDTASAVIPASLTEDGEDAPLPVAELQAWIPVPASADPATRSVLVVTFATPSVEDWEVYCPVVVDVLRSIRFSSPADV